MTQPKHHKELPDRIITRGAKTASIKGVEGVLSLAEIESRIQGDLTINQIKGAIKNQHQKNAGVFISTDIGFIDKKEETKTKKSSKEKQEKRKGSPRHS